MSMIEATAVENRRVQQSPATAPHAVERGWRVGPLITWAASLMVVVGVGTAIIGSALGLREPPVIAVDPTSDKRPEVVVTPMAEPRVESSRPAPEPGGSASVSVEAKAEPGGIETGSLPAAKPGAPPELKSAAKREAKPDLEPEVKPQAKVVAVLPVESPASGAETETVTKSRRDDSIAAEDPPIQQPAAEMQLSPPTVSKADSPVDSTAAVRMARMVSDANLRAGPSNGQAVVATIRRGSAIEVIECRTWCEVIYSGQRGWVYKGYVGASETPSGR